MGNKGNSIKSKRIIFSFVKRLIDEGKKSKRPYIPLDMNINDEK
jgi:hypothetical protein